MLLSNFRPEIPKSSIFVPKFKLFFSQNSKGADFKYDNFFSISSPKISQTRIFGPKFSLFFFFCKILEIDKFQAADIKYDNIVSKFLAQKYINEVFLVKNVQ